MHNYEHEIPCPDDRAIRKFLWFDYFCDSEIEGIEFDRNQTDCLILRLRCDRDERACWNRFLGDYGKWHAYITENAEKYTYLLRFKRVAFFEGNMVTGGRKEFINARFKDTALLRRFQKKSDCKLYHLRIQTGCGRIDLVFGGFEIRKVSGRVSYEPVREIGQLPLLSGERGLRTAIRAEEYDGMPEDDFERFLLLMNMDQNDDEHLTDAARACMKDDIPCEDAKPYAAHLLGRNGEISDIPAMIKLFFEAEDELENDPGEYQKLLMHRQNIHDAIEFVRYRAKESKQTASFHIAD